MKRHGYLAPPAQARENKADDNMARFTVRWLGHAAGLLLMLLATACATPPAPQVATPPPPGQARIWFYRLWDPSESLNAANIDVNGVYFDSVEPGSAFYRDVAPGVYQIAPQNEYLDYNQNTNVAVVPGQQVFIAVLDLSSWANAVSGAQRSVHRDSWYARLVPPQYALAEITSPALVPRPNALPAAPLVY
jgi:Protein of unknown function (DUF2846)